MCLPVVGDGITGSPVVSLVIQVRRDRRDGEGENERDKKTLLLFLSDPRPDKKHAAGFFWVGEKNYLLVLVLRNATGAGIVLDGV